MDFLEKTKEQAHKNKKPHQSKYASSIGKVCERCRGVCIFSKDFLEKYQKSRDLRKKLDENFFTNEFELLRAFQDQNDTVEKNEVKKKLSEDDDDEIALSAFDLVKLFHTLDQSQKGEIMKVHCAGSEYIRYVKHFPSQISKHEKLVRPIPTKEDYSYSNENMHRMPRQKKKSELVLDGICDKRME